LKWDGIKRFSIKDCGFIELIPVPIYRIYIDMPIIRIRFKALTFNVKESGKFITFGAIMR
jgi:hypothetical protein